MTPEWRPQAMARPDHRNRKAASPVRFMVGAALLLIAGLVLVGAGVARWPVGEGLIPAGELQAMSLSTTPTGTAQARQRSKWQPPPTATLPGTPAPRAGHWENPELGISLEHPRSWTARPGESEGVPLVLLPDAQLVGVLVYAPMSAGDRLDEAANLIEQDLATNFEAKQVSSRSLRLKGGQEVRLAEYSGRWEQVGEARIVAATTVHRGKLFSLIFLGAPEAVEDLWSDINDVIQSMTFSAPAVYGIPRDQALVLLGGESNNPREYDPATGSGDYLIFSGLVSFNPKMELVPELAERWQVSEDGTVYTFHLRKNARFHDGRAVTAHDIVYSWERAANPATESHTVLTYLGDIVGVKEMHEGKAGHISGLKIVDDHTLQVTIDAPKPYFLMKLTYAVAHVVDRNNVESGPDWYRTPNGTGPYRLVRWEPNKVRLYERYERFYLKPPAIRFVVVQLYAGTGLRLYETGDIDITGISRYDVDRVRDPAEPMSRELLEGVSMCTSMVTFDVKRPPFDDPRVRQAFALAVDRQRYVDIVARGAAIPARGLYPPALPGYNPALQALQFDPQLAQQRLAESRYGGPGNLPAIVFTASGFGSDVSPHVAALVDMWEKHLGVKITIENLEPDKYFDELHAGRHGHMFSEGWCADYPDPENFADALYHSHAQQNDSNYSNPQVDALLERARVERDVSQRIALYQQAEQMIVQDAPSVFLSHSLSFTLVKPYVRGYVLTPIAVPIERYLTLDRAQINNSP
jgi:ABC-type transport system substrate-binding protein